MIDYTLPKSVNIDDTQYKIRNDCDFRVVLDVICALNDIELSDNEKIYCALKIFYGDIPQDKDLQQAVVEMMKIINNGEEEKPSNEPQKPPIMNWEHDFKYLVAPINRVLGFDIRTVDYLHWWRRNLSGSRSPLRFPQHTIYRYKHRSPGILSGNHAGPVGPLHR